MENDMPVFWGCTLLHNYPFLIESTKKVLDKIGVGVMEVEGFGCCPDPVYMKSCGRDSHQSLSARNLSLARKHSKEMLVVCNGCFNVLSEAASELENPVRRDIVNSFLPVKNKYEGGLEVVHLTRVISSKTSLLKTLVEKPLSGLRVAVHYGCHILYPPAVPGDDPRNPTSLETIVEATGAKAVDYESRLDCCGVPVGSFDQEEADGLLEKKLIDMNNAKADCIVTSCPACFMRFDMPPARLKDKALPVFHLSELLCLAMGVPPEELHLDLHMTKSTGLIEKLGSAEKITERELIAGNFDLEELANHCQACREECTAAITTRNTPDPFDPLDAVDRILEGRLYEVIRGKEIWRCLQCGKCEERCPNNSGLKGFYAKLRELSIADGNAPRIINDKIKMLEETGYAMPKRMGVRKKMGIEPAPETEKEEIAEILKKTRRRDK